MSVAAEVIAAVSTAPEISTAANVVTEVASIIADARIESMVTIAIASIVAGVTAMAAAPVVPAITAAPTIAVAPRIAAPIPAGALPRIVVPTILPSAEEVHFDVLGNPYVACRAELRNLHVVIRKCASGHH
jgi:hypothetical protein